MKSKVLSDHVHSRLASSISIFRLGGTKAGWVGDTSVPITRAAGNSSANSLVKGTEEGRELVSHTTLVGVEE